MSIESIVVLILHITNNINKFESMAINTPVSDTMPAYNLILITISFVAFVLAFSLYFMKKHVLNTEK